MSKIGELKFYGPCKATFGANIYPKSGHPDWIPYTNNSWVTTDPAKPIVYHQTNKYYKNEQVYLYTVAVEEDKLNDDENTSRIHYQYTITPQTAAWFNGWNNKTAAAAKIEIYNYDTKEKLHEASIKRLNSIEQKTATIILEDYFSVAHNIDGTLTLQVIAYFYSYNEDNTADKYIWDTMNTTWNKKYDIDKDGTIAKDEWRYGTHYLPTSADGRCLMKCATLNPTCAINLACGSFIDHVDVVHKSDGSRSDITIEVGGGTVFAKIGDTITLTATPQDGYVFKYWKIGDKEVTGKTYTFIVTGPIDISAIGGKVAKTVSFDLDYAATESFDPITVYYMEPYGKLPTPTPRKGYAFKGWYTQKDGKGNKITSNSIFTYSTNIVLYAYWELTKRVKVHVNIDTNGEEVLANEDVLYVTADTYYIPGQTATVTANSSDGFIFDYFDSLDGTEKITTPKYSFTVPESETIINITAHANIRTIDMVYTNKDPATGSIETITDTKKYNRVYSIKSLPKVTGYKFDYWEDKLGNKYRAGQVIRADMNSPLEFTSHWIYDAGFKKGIVWIKTTSGWKF